MIIDGFDKLTLLDYPGYIACIIFTRGCNFSCSYCQNSSLIKHKSESGLIKEEEIIDYLNLRKNVLDGIVISGGEPTVQKGLVDFIRKIKTLNIKVKLDTNGSNPTVLKQLIDENLIDYVAMDIKNDFKNYEKVTKSVVNVENIKKSIEILKKGKIDYEFRTTIIKEYHSLDSILEILKIVGDSKYYIQNFKMSDLVMDKTLHGFSEEELKEIRKKLKNYKNVFMRDL